MTYGIITGASAGLGWEFARELARRGGRDLILVARRQERLERLKSELLSEFGTRSELIVADLTTERGVDAVREVIQTKDISILINNAGFGGVGRLVDQAPEAQCDMIRLNCLAATALAGEFVRCRRNKPIPSFLVNVASTAAFQPIPLMATYAATKSFLLSFSLALGEEMRDSSVRVMALCPGPTRTEFHLVSGLPEKLALLPSMSAAEVVAEALSALEGNRRYLITGWVNRALSVLGSALPYWVTLPTLMAKLEPEISQMGRKSTPEGPGN